MLASYLMGILAFSLLVSLVLVGMHFLNKTPSLYMLSISALSCYIVLLVISLIFVDHVFFWSYSILYWFLVMSYFFVFFSLLKSVSVGVLVSLLHAPDFRLNYRDILENYLVNDSFDKRINILISNSLADIHEGKLVLTGKGRMLASVYVKIQKIFSVEESG